MDIRLRVSGGGHTSQIYALRQAIAKAVVAYVAKYEDAASALEVRKVLVAYDRTLLVADPRRCEPKKFGGKGARSRYQKSSVCIFSVLVSISRWGCGGRIWECLQKRCTSAEGTRGGNGLLFEEQE